MTDGWQIAPGLMRLAQGWATYIDVTERPCQGPNGAPLPFAPACDLPHNADGRHLAVIERCRACGEEVFPTDLTGKLRHLLTSHGFRMDGRQFDNQNQQVGYV